MHVMISSSSDGIKHKGSQECSHNLGPWTLMSAYETMLCGRCQANAWILACAADTEDAVEDSQKDVSKHQILLCASANHSRNTVLRRIFWKLRVCASMC